MNQRVDQKSARRDAIIAAAAVQFGQHGFEATTFGRIAEELGQPRSWIGYHLFPSKESLASAVVEAQRARWEGLFERVGAVPEGLPRLLTALLDAADEARSSAVTVAAVRLLREAPALSLTLPSLATSWRDFAIRQVRFEAEEQGARVSVDPAVFATQLLAASFGVFETNRPVWPSIDVFETLAGLWTVLLSGAGFEIPELLRRTGLPRS